MARPLQLLRELALAAERAAAEEAASGMVKGAADRIREEVPELDDQLRTLLRDVISALGRMAHAAANGEVTRPVDAVHSMAAAAMAGALQELEREWQDGGMPLHSFIARVNALLDRGADYIEKRAHEFGNPAARAHDLAAGFVEGATEKLHDRTPAIVEDLRSFAPLSSEIAHQAGRGAIEGVQSKLREEGDAFAAFLEQAGRGLVRGLAAALEEEVTSRAGALRAQARGGLRGASREITQGVLDALGGTFKTPLAAAVAAGAALLTVGLFVRRP